jgi:hypothetical protein
MSTTSLLMLASLFFISTQAAEDPSPTIHPSDEMVRARVVEFWQAFVRQDNVALKRLSGDLVYDDLQRVVWVKDVLLTAQGRGKEAAPPPNAVVPELTIDSQESATVINRTMFYTIPAIKVSCRCLSADLHLDIFVSDHPDAKIIAFTHTPPAKMINPY